MLNVRRCTFYEEVSPDWSAGAENCFLSVPAEFDSALLRGVGVNHCTP